MTDEARPTKRARLDDGSATAPARRAPPPVLQWSVDVERFYNARAREVSALSAAVAGGRGGRRAFQQLPRHLRRRAMSHRPHLLPARYRARALAENAKSRAAAPVPTHTPSQHGEGSGFSTTPGKGKRRYLRHKRRVARLRKTWRAEGGDARWLATHRWHAKRFHMATRFRCDVRVPMRSTNRGAKAAYRAARDECVMRDLGHERCIALHAHEADLRALLRHLAPATASLTGAHALELVLAAVHVPALLLVRPLAPVLHASGGALFDAAREAWLLVHVDAAEDALVALRGTIEALRLHVDCSLCARDSQLNAFELSGPLSGAVVTRALLHACASSSAPSPLLAPLSAALLQSAALLPRGAVYALRVASVAQHRQWASLQDLRAASPSPSPSFLARAQAEHAQSPLWELEAERDADTELLLVRCSSTCAGAGLRVFVRRREAAWAWLRLVHAGARAIGELEADHLCAEFCQPAFPLDWPRSASGAALAAASVLAAQRAWLAQPPARRPAMSPTARVAAHAAEGATQCVWLVLDGGGRAALGDAVLHPLSCARIGSVSRAHFSWRHGAYLAVAHLDVSAVADLQRRASAHAQTAYALVERASGDRLEATLLCA